MTSIGDRAFYYCDDISKLTIPDSVLTIETEAFYLCMGLEELTLGRSLTSIGDMAFNSCDKLKEVKIPDSVTFIGAAAFGGCHAMREAAIGGSAATVGGFPDCGELRKVTIGDSVGSINGGAFKYCSNLTEITIGNSVSSIGGRAFYECTSLTEIIIPDSVTSIGNEAFSECTGLKEIIIPDSVTTIGTLAFYGCKSLTKLSVPASVTEFGFDSLGRCSQLTDIYYGGTQEQWNWLNHNYAFAISIDEDVRIHYNAEISVECSHSQQELIPGTAASCTESGLTDGAKCSKCGAIVMEQQLIAALGHLEVVDEEVPATCTEMGITEGRHCQRCNAVLVKKELIPAAGHRFVGGVCTVCKAIAPNDSPENDTNPFVDVSEGDWYYKPVLWAVRNGITGGSGAGTFSPESACTRGQIVTFLWAASGRPMPMSAVNPFVDVENTDYFAQAVLWAVENGITNGTSADTFSPDAPCTRAQVATFLYAAQGKPALQGSGSGFSDVADDAWYLAPVLWAVENGVTSGVGNGNFGPEQICSRAQIVTFLNQVYGNP